MAQVNHSKSKKISELQARNVITAHQENSWIPIAQYDSRVHSYTNISLNVQSITSYSFSYACSYSVNYTDKQISDISTYFLAYSYNLSNINYAYTTGRYYDLLDKIQALGAQQGEQLDALAELYKLKVKFDSLYKITEGKTYEEIAPLINADPVASTLVSYTFAYTTDSFGWQRINGNKAWTNIITE